MLRPHLLAQNKSPVISASAWFEHKSPNEGTSKSPQTKFNNADELCKDFAAKFQRHGLKISLPKPYVIIFKAVILRLKSGCAQSPILARRDRRARPCPYSLRLSIERRVKRFMPAHRIAIKERMLCIIGGFGWTENTPLCVCFGEYGDLSTRPCPVRNGT